MTTNWSLSRFTIRSSPISTECAKCSEGEIPEFPGLVLERSRFVNSIKNTLFIPAISRNIDGGQTTFKLVPPAAKREALTLR
jgi:hypothetical protein